MAWRFAAVLPDGIGRGGRDRADACFRSVSRRRGHGPGSENSGEHDKQQQRREKKPAGAHMVQSGRWVRQGRVTCLRLARTIVTKSRKFFQQDLSTPPGVGQVSVGEDDVDRCGCVDAMQEASEQT